MGGKGQRRREKNFKAAHGCDNRLPPPPKLKELEAIPSKLRRLMELQINPPPRPTLQSGSLKVDVKKGESGRGRGKSQKDVHSVNDSQFELGNNIDETVPHIDKEDRDGMQEKKKRKKKRKTLSDLHVQSLNMAADQLTKRKRKKEFLEARKKKNKKPNINDIREFPGREDIKFGEVVQAPPKLSVPKAFTSHDASHERLRLKAVEAYRNRKGWVSRPGMHFSAEAPSS